MTKTQEVGSYTDRMALERMVVPEKKTSRTIQSVERALALLELLSESSGETKLGDLAAKSGFNVSTCHHLLLTLIKSGFAGQNKRSRGYFLGARITELSERRLKQFDFRETALAELRRLNDGTLECVHLAVMQGVYLVTLTRFDSKLPVRVGFDDGQKTDAAHATATGKAILAWLPETEIARVIAHCGLRRFTDKTISTITGLMEELRLVRRNGYSVDHEEFQPGVVCVGAAIRDHTGAVIGSVGSSMPSVRAEGDHIEGVRRQVQECAAVISSRYGSPAHGN